MSVKQTIKLVQTDGVDTAMVEAYVYGPVAVYNDGLGWNAYHVNTGMYLGRYNFAKKRHAVAYAMALTETLDLEGISSKDDLFEKYDVLDVTRARDDAYRIAHEKR